MSQVPEVLKQNVLKTRAFLDSSCFRPWAGESTVAEAPWGVGLRGVFDALLRRPVPNGTLLAAAGRHNTHAVD